MDKVKRRKGRLKWGKRIGIGIEKKERRRIERKEKERKLKIRSKEEKKEREEEMIIRSIKLINERKIEKGDIIEKEIRIEMGWGKKKRKKRRENVRNIGRDRVGKIKLRIEEEKGFGMRLWNEGIGKRLNNEERGENKEGVESENM